MKVNGGLIASPDPAYPPTIAIPESLALPDAGRIVTGTGDISRAAVSRAAVVPIAGTVIARAIVTTILRRDGAADNGTTDQARGDASGNTTLGVGGRGNRHSRYGQAEQRTANKWSVAPNFHISLE